MRTSEHVHRLTQIVYDRQVNAALRRIWSAYERAEQEYPLLAAPDGMVSVHIDDLRFVLGKAGYPQ